MKQTPAYDIANADILGLVPSGARRVIDVGCMLGTLGRAIRERSPATQVVGLDIDPDYAQAAAQHCNEAHHCDIERIAPALWESLFPSDCWIFGDCLEHLRDPWQLLRNLRARIDAGGCLLVCLPNAQHWSVQMRLATGQFRYEESGLMDRTHLRWFTRATLIDMLVGTGWTVEHGLSRNLPGSAQQDAVVEALRGVARACGFDAEQAAADAVPFQYIFKCVAA